MTEKQLTDTIASDGNPLSNSTIATGFRATNRHAYLSEIVNLKEQNMRLECLADELRVQLCCQATEAKDGKIKQRIQQWISQCCAVQMSCVRDTSVQDLKTILDENKAMRNLFLDLLNGPISGLLSDDFRKKFNNIIGQAAECNTNPDDDSSSVHTCPSPEDISSNSRGVVFNPRLESASNGSDWDIFCASNRFH